MAIETIKGFRDIDNASNRIAIRNVIEGVFKNYNFIPVETPVIESEELVRGENTNDEAVSDVFKLRDRGNRPLALRYEFTFQLKRLSLNKKLPYKRYQIGYVFRDEPTGGNRWKQFTQCDIDVVGSNIKEEAEILCIAKEIFSKLGIKVTINVNNRKLLNEILEKEGVKQKAEVIREIDKMDKLSSDEIRANLKKYKAEKILDVFNQKEKYFEKYESYKEIAELKKECKDFDVEINFVPFLARGLSYYNGSIFEIKASELKETISAGGSYMVNGNQSSGISFGLDRLELLSKLKEVNNKTLIISIGQDKKARELATSLREKNIPCSIMYGKVTKALEYANSYSIPYVLFVGEEEIKSKKFLMRNMTSGKEEKLSEKQLLEKFD